MKKRVILFLALITFIPSIAKAGILEDYKLKWTEEGFDAYAYNPILELDRSKLEEDAFIKNGTNQSKIIEDSEGYIIIGNFSLKKYSRTKGLIKELLYDEMRAIEYDNHIIVISISYQTNELKIEKIDKDLNVVNKKNIKGVELKKQFIENEKLIVVYQDINEEYISSYVINLKDFSEVNKSSIFVGHRLYNNYYNRYIYDDGINYFYLDKNYNIVPELLNSDNTYEIIDYSSLKKYNKNNELQKTIDCRTLTKSGYTFRGCSVVKNKTYYYIAATSYIYNSSTRKYTVNTKYYKYNTNLEQITSIEKENNNQNYIDDTYLYSNEKGVFTYFCGQRFKIDDNFQFTTTQKDNLYNNEFVHPQGIKEEEYEPTELVELYSIASKVLHNKRNNIEDEICENKSNCYANIEYRYDFYYDEKREEGYVLVTWEISQSTLDYEYQYSEIYIVNEDNDINDPIIIPFIDETEVTEYFDRYWQKSFGSKIEVTDDYLIFASTVNGETYINVYDKNYELVEDLYLGTTGMNVVQKIDYEKGHLMIIVGAYRPIIEPSSLDGEINQSNNTTTKQNSNMKELEYSLEHDGLSHYAYEYAIAYFERPYNIETKTDGNGTVEADHIEAEGGTEVRFTVKPEDGYVLGEVKVTDAYGNVVIFTDYTFTMPSADVLIEASFKKIELQKEEKNPETADITLLICLLLITTGTFIYVKTHKKANWLK